MLLVPQTFLSRALCSWAANQCNMPDRLTPNLCYPLLAFGTSEFGLLSTPWLGVASWQVRSGGRKTVGTVGRMDRPTVAPRRDRLARACRQSGYDVRALPPWLGPRVCGNHGAVVAR